MKKFILRFVLLTIVLTANRGWATVYVPTVTNDPPVSGGVNSANGVITGGAGAGAVSLRSAVIAANAHAGADAITLAAGTYNLTLAGSDNDASGGDLDINDSLNINGVTAATTIVKMVSPGVGDYKVFGINQDGSHTGLSVAFNNVTITGGNNNFVSTGTFQETGGGIDFFLTGTGNNYSMGNCIITGNSATGSAQSHGGGVNVDSANAATVGGPSAGTVTFNSCTFSNNTASHEGGGLQCFADKHDVTIINCTFTGNNAENGGGLQLAHSFGGTTTMLGGLITNNTALQAGGGLVIGRNTTVSVSGVTIVGNTSTGSGGSSAGGGVAIVELGLAGFTPTITLSGCTITNNHANNGAAAAGGGVYYGHVYSATLTNCTISGNTSGTGAGVYNTGSSSTPPDMLTVNNCTIIGNTASVSGGGVAHAATFTAVVTINNSTIIGNSAATSGGGIFVPGGTNTMTFSRIVNNTAPTGKAVAQTGGTVTALNDWWGTNAPAALMSGTVGFTPNLQLRHTANPNTIFVPNATTLTATFLTNSAGTAVSAANLTALVGVPVTFNNAVRGTLSGAQTTIQSSGTATATFTANTAGAGSADATVDSQTVTASITIPTGVSSINRVQTTPTNLSSVSWTVTFTNAVSGVASGNFSLVNVGLGGSPAITSVTAVGGAPATSWTVTASTGSGTGTLGLNMANGTAVSASIVNLPFTGQVYSIDFVAPTVTCSTNITVTANGSCPVVVNYTVSAGDNVALALATTNPASGSAFAVGTNTVTLTARDTAGNTNFCTFKVIVLPGAAPQLSILRSSTNVVVSWSNSFPCYTLQFAPKLASNTWSSYPGPFATNGGKIYVTNSAAITNRFFRLKF